MEKTAQNCHYRHFHSQTMKQKDSQLPKYEDTLLLQMSYFHHLSQHFYLYSSSIVLL